MSIEILYRSNIDLRSSCLVGDSATMWFAMLQAKRSVNNVYAWAVGYTVTSTRISHRVRIRETLDGAR